jgi:hypothetical protein
VNRETLANQVFGWLFLFKGFRVNILELNSNNKEVIMSWNITEKFKKLLQTIKNWFSSNPDVLDDIADEINTGTTTEPVVTPVEPTIEPVTEPITEPVTEPVVTSSADEIPFSSLNWSYGGFKGENSVAIPETVISNLTFSGNKMLYKWVKGGCEKFGAGNAHDYSMTLSCMFVKNNKGKWVGGKFDWISTDRLSRDLKNCLNGYHGWNLKDVPNPAEAAFLIAGVSSPNGGSPSGKRTNVIKGTWKR